MKADLKSPERLASGNESLPLPRGWGSLPQGERRGLRVCISAVIPGLQTGWGGALVPGLLEGVLGALGGPVAAAKPEHHQGWYPKASFLG